MLLYLMRHGEAVSEGEDPKRPLSRNGAEKVTALGGLLAGRIVMTPGNIYSSPKTRAAQTATILSEALSGVPAPQEMDGLLPMDDPAVWCQRLESLDRDVMLVGHLPHMSRLASTLLLWESGRDIFTFSPGTVLCLERSSNWKVKWMISPDILKKM